jgi:hypothetical protein
MIAFNAWITLPEFKEREPNSEIWSYYPTNHTFKPWNDEDADLVDR